MPAGLYPWMHLAGRILFCTVFIMSGMNHFLQKESMTHYARSKGLPAPGVLVVVSGIVIVVGALMVLLGWHRFIGAGLLFLFLLAAAFLVHPFWKEESPQLQILEMSHFLKDLGLAGAALLVAYYAGEPWPFSLTLPF